MTTGPKLYEVPTDIEILMPSIYLQVLCRIVKLGFVLKKVV